MTTNTMHKPIVAVYREQELPEYAGNPLIEALPPILSAENWAKCLTRPIKFSPTDLLAERHLREHMVFRLREFHQPLPESIQFAMAIDQMLRQGYIHRNPATANRAKTLQSLYERIQAGTELSGSFSDLHPMLATSLVGVSGMGKTTTAELIMDRFTQFIDHPRYSIHQVVWLKVNCPNDGKPSGLALSIINEFSQIVGFDFMSQLPARPSDTQLWSKVLHLSAVYSLGMIVIDEVQNMSARRSGSWEIMLNYFQELCNQLKLPIVVMGTMKAARIFRVDFRHARRNAASGSYVWDRLANDGRWEFLLERLWTYQWVRNPAPLTSEIRDSLYKLTQGIIAVLTVLFILAQRHAIERGEETLTEGIFKRVMDKQLTPLHGMLEALRSGSAKRIQFYEDLQPIEYEKLLDREEQRMLLGAVKNTPTTVSGVPTIEEAAIETLIRSTQLPAEQVRALVMQVASSSHCKTAAALVRKVRELMAEHNGGMEGLSTPEIDALDLRRLDSAEIADLESQCVLNASLTKSSR